MNIYRSPLNPIIKPMDIIPSRPDFEVICAFNAGVIRVGEEIILLLRIAERPINNRDNVYLCPVFDNQKGGLTILEFSKDNKDYDFSDSREIGTPHGRYLTSISHLRVARSKDGIHFEIDDKPTLFPQNEYEIFGIEDPRITYIEDKYYINYSAVSNLGITSYLVSTSDFVNFQRHGNIFHPDNKDITIFSEKVGGKYYALHRPSASRFGKPEIWIAESSDLVCWGNHRYLMGTRDGIWDDGRIGASAVPFRVEGGWLEIYHGANKNDRYCLGAVLLDAEQPWKILARSECPIMKPEADYEVDGFFGNVIFNCGVLLEDNIVKVYYGAADTYTCYAEIKLEEIMNTLR